jgi:predicted CXXCH cytochrome family protein
LQTDSAPSAGGHGGDAASSQCAACHASHGGDRGGRLLKPEKPGDGLCLGCHGDQDARPITPELAKSSAHARDARGRHDAGEGPDAPASRRLPETSLGSLRHSSCVDCHDPHTSNATPAFAPRGAGAIAGVWGIDLDGKRVAHAQNEYEVCLKCHGDSANKPQDAEAFGLDGPKRQHKVTNLRLAFSPSAVSYHPVAAPGRTAVVPGLKGGLTSASVILCTDCHNSDSSRAAGGTGANGPHGSKYPHLLERQYLTRDRTQESPDAYALCYKCHDRGVLLSDQSSFPHLAHVRSSSTPCSACHASHGISADAALGQGGTRLVSFDLSIVRPSRTGALRHESGGPADGACALNCHNTEHGPGEKYWNY